MIDLAPVVLFVYNRLNHTRLTVDALKNNALAIDSDLIVFSDAPRSDAQEDAVQEVREYIRDISGFRSVSIIQRETNFGLANSIIDGVTTVINQRGKVIVLEDDLTVTPYFLSFMNSALDTYANDERIMQVSGYMFPVKLDVKADALFLPLTTSWGWATWKRSWELFDADAKGYMAVKTDLTLRKRFNLDGAYDYFSMLEAQLSGKIDSWAIRWHLVAFMNEKLTLYPKQSLIANTGFDGSGTHGAITGFLALSTASDGFNPKSFPEIVEVSSEWTTVKSSLSKRLTLFSRVKNKLRHVFD